METAEKYGVYITAEGDMWDSISYKLYGTERAAGELVELNERYSGYAILPGGLEIKVFLFSQTAASTAKTLPPWKQR